MLPILLASAALALTPVSPTIQFTSDSVYTKNNILSYEIVEHYTEEEIPTLISKDLVLKENHLLGYTIYDVKETEYIDGLKIDGQFVFDWKVSDFDDTKDHLIQIKTFYTEDAAGILVAAKDGDWSLLLANPLVIFQIIYYVLAAISLIIGGFGLLKSKKSKVKTSEEIAGEVSKQADLAKEHIIATTIALITPLFKKLNSQNSDIIKALVMSKSQNNNDTLALLDLLKNAQSGEDLTELVERIKKEAEEAFAKSATAKKEAIETIDAIADGVFKETEDDGTSI